MSWLFSRALVAEYSAENFSGGEQFAQLSASPTPQAFLRSDRMTEFSRLSRFGMTFAPLTENRGEELLMSYLAAFPVKTLARQEMAQDSMGREAVCGWRWQGSLAKYDPATSLWRTRQCSLLGGSEEFSETWPRWGSMLNGELLERQKSGGLIAESESGLLPTPRASVGTHGICWKRAKSGEHRSQIEDFLGWLSLKNGGQVVSGRTVNADFQDWLMGWPVAWSDLQPLETGSFQQWLQQHSPSCPSETEVAA